MDAFRGVDRNTRRARNVAKPTTCVRRLSFPSRDVREARQQGDLQGGLPFARGPVQNRPPPAGTSTYASSTTGTVPAFAAEWPITPGFHEGNLSRLAGPAPNGGRNRQVLSSRSSSESLLKRAKLLLYVTGAGITYVEISASCASVPPEQLVKLARGLSHRGRDSAALPLGFPGEEENSWQLLLVQEPSAWASAGRT